MSEREIVRIELSAPEKILLANQLSAQSEKLGMGDDISKLDLGFDLPENWPVDLGDEPTMAKLIVVARKLKMKIVINGISLYPDGN